MLGRCWTLTPSQYCSPIYVSCWPSGRIATPTRRGRLLSWDTYRTKTLLTRFWSTYFLIRLTSPPSLPLSPSLSLSLSFSLSSPPLHLPPSLTSISAFFLLSFFLSFSTDQAVWLWPNNVLVDSTGQYWSGSKSQTRTSKRAQKGQPLQLTASSGLLNYTGSGAPGLSQTLLSCLTAFRVREESVCIEILSTAYYWGNQWILHPEVRNITQFFVLFAIIVF